MTQEIRDTTLWSFIKFIAQRYMAAPVRTGLRAVKVPVSEILRTKNANRDYIFGNNGITVDPFWGLRPIRTNKIAIGNFLVGNSSPNAMLIRDRMQMQLLISDSHSDYFVKNK